MPAGPRRPVCCPPSESSPASVSRRTDSEMVGLEIAVRAASSARVSSGAASS